MVLAQELPDVFDRVQLGGIGWQAKYVYGFSVGRDRRRPPLPHIPGSDSERGCGLALVCPQCLTPSQNLGDLPILEPSALFSLSRYGRVASWHRVGVGGGRSAGATGGPIPRSAELIGARTVGLTVCLDNLAQSTCGSLSGPVIDCCIENECAFGSAKARRCCCLVRRNRGLHRSYRMVRHRCGWKRGCKCRLGNAVRRSYASRDCFRCRGGLVVAVSRERALAASGGRSPEVRARSG